LFIFLSFICVSVYMCISHFKLSFQKYCCSRPVV
jgi:hypothetical protein